MPAPALDLDDPNAHFTLLFEVDPGISTNAAAPQPDLPLF